MSYQKVRGMILVLTGAVLWGVSGTVAQYLFQGQGFEPEWLVTCRLLVAGVLLTGYTYWKDGKSVWTIWGNKHERLSLVLFGLLGMLGVQYTYFAAIEASNAATATILQYLGPVFIAVYLAIRLRRIPGLQESLALLLALAGTFLLVTHGDLQRLAISGRALFWGLSSAVALAFYTLQPRSLLDKWSASLVTGWGMLIGGISFSLIHPPWLVSGVWSLESFLAVAFIVLFGTLVAFYCYLESLNYISAMETSLLACVEPLSAALLSVVWLKVPFGATDWLGTAGIIAALIILSLMKPHS